MDGVSEEQKTAEVLNQIMDNIFPFLKFELETPEQFPNWRLPKLDFQCWFEGDKVK